ncbi:MAG TPA: hypothetical protein PKA64_07250, partial [Myxococcota bacterium]|nr:hypothetical protein [Myxococcota bacterium]
MRRRVAERPLPRTPEEPQGAPQEHQEQDRDHANISAGKGYVPGIAPACHFRTPSGLPFETTHSGSLSAAIRASRGR